ncbi:hypothetical protein [Micromonospora sp. WMMD714]|uniref:hypothetical protein n=1 Tax=Micromonospora sp. WMMD714 TaxID=3016097 RepID=UPI002499C842|nr:hypothetical protein [Micromonospora sp. WMMD714]WFE65008.1 hypothetical protein O7625_17800 [Micromonospora sp. WMMD714]
MYALYAWGNFIGEVGLDRRPAWLDPTVLRGERQVVDESLMIGDTDTLLVDGAGTLFEIDDDKNLVPGSALIGRDLSGVTWRVSRIRVATDGTREDALRIVAAIEEDSDFYEEHERHEYNSVPVGEVVTLWEDDHGQWTMALVEL